MERIVRSGGTRHRYPCRPRTRRVARICRQARQGTRAHAWRGPRPGRRAVRCRRCPRADPRHRTRERRSRRVRGSTLAVSRGGNDHRDSAAVPVLSRRKPAPLARARQSRCPCSGGRLARRVGPLAVYTANFASYGKTYGALASIVVILLWLWLSSLVVLVGAEVDGAHESNGLDPRSSVLPARLNDKTQRLDRLRQLRTRAGRHDLVRLHAAAPVRHDRRRDGRSRLVRRWPQERTLGRRLVGRPLARRPTSSRTRRASQTEAAGSSVPSLPSFWGPFPSGGRGLAGESPSIAQVNETRPAVTRARAP